MYRFILGINSFWLLFPLYTISFSVNYLLYIHTILTSFISALYWFTDYNRLLHNIDRINAILYYFHLMYNDTINIIYLFVILFYGLSHYLEYKNKNIESLFAHLSFRKCGFCIVYLQLVNKPENLYMIIMLYYLHLYYLLLANNNIIKRTIELFIYKFLIIYVSSNVYPILR